VLYKKSYLLGEWSDSPMVGKGFGIAGMLLVSTTALRLSPLALTLSESECDRNVIVHTQLDSSAFNYKSGVTGMSWPYRLHVVIIKVCVHILTVAGPYAVVKFGFTDAGWQTRNVFATQSLLYSFATTEVERLKQRSELTAHELRPCTIATCS
jgi:hypothetical protein